MTNTVIAPSTSFGLRTTEELYESLVKIAAPRLIEVNRPSALDCASFAAFSWALLKDWICKFEHSTLRRDKASMLAMERDKRMPDDHPLRLFCFVLRDLANGSKHQNLHPEKQENSPIKYVQNGMQSSWFDYFFKRDQIVVNLKNGMFFSAASIARITLSILEWVMDDAKPIDNLPGIAITEIWLSNNQHWTPKIPLPIGALPLPADHPKYVHYCAQQGIPKEEKS